MKRSSAVMRPSLAKPTLRAPGHVGARAADVAFLLAADAHHHRRVGLLREQRRDRHRDGAARPCCRSRRRCTRRSARRPTGGMPTQCATCRARDATLCVERVEEQLAVLPVGHRAARFHRVVPGGLHDEGLVEHERGGGEAGVEIAEGPLLERACPSAAALAAPRRSPRRSTSASRAWRRGRSGGALGAGRRRRAPDVAVQPRVRPCRAAGCRADR